jgi:hypothetical protein
MGPVWDEASVAGPLLRPGYQSDKNRREDQPFPEQSPHPFECMHSPSAFPVQEPGSRTIAQPQNPPDTPKKTFPS